MSTSFYPIQIRAFPNYNIGNAKQACPTEKLQISSCFAPFIQSQRITPHVSLEPYGSIMTDICILPQVSMHILMIISRIRTDVDFKIVMTICRRDLIRVAQPKWSWLGKAIENIYAGSKLYTSMKWYVDCITYRIGIYLGASESE